MNLGWRAMKEGVVVNGSLSGCVVINSQLSIEVDKVSRETSRTYLNPHETICTSS